MNENILLSVVVLSYNNEQYIEECLESIENQGLEAFEVLIVDDCSTDNSVAVINNFIENRPEFTLIQKKQNTGGAISSQIGLERSRGKYCAVIDSDDIVAPGAYKKLISRLETDGSDFAAGMPVVFRSGCFFDALPSQRELDLFSCDRILDAEERARYSNQVYYSNSVFRTAFIRENNIKMPDGLLIADRVFMDQAIYRASRISVDSSVVYYWRQQKIPNKPSITEKDRKYPGIADRCDSYEAQLRVTLENAEKNGSISLEIWGNNYERLFVPLTHLLNTDPMDVENLKSVFDRYRMLMVSYPSFFIHLIHGGTVSALHTYYTINILENRFDNILRIAGFNRRKESLIKELLEDRNPLVKKAVLRESADFSVSSIQKEGQRIYLYIQNPHREFGNIRIEKVIAISNCYRLKQYVLDYDCGNNKIDITDLPESTYNFLIHFSAGREHYQRPVRNNVMAGTRISYTDANCCIISSNKGGNPFKIFNTNRYALVNTKGEALIAVNQGDNKIAGMFFYNTADNSTVRLPEMSGQVYKMTTDFLHDGRNILFAEYEDGTYATVDKRQFSSSAFQLKEMEHLFKSNIIEIAVTPDN